MIRHSLGRAALAGVLLWVTAQTAVADDPKPGLTPQTQKINELIRKGYETAGIARPAARATDDEFLRRVFIDLVGRIATPEEVIDFERDSAADKRVKLVQRLLNDDKYQPKNKGGQFIQTGKETSGTPQYLKFDYTNEYAEHWANIWTVWLLTRTGHADYREEMRLWLEVNLAKNISHRDMVTRLLTASGRVGDLPVERKYKDSYAANFIIHHLGEPVRDDPMTPNVNERLRDGAFDAVPITSRVSKLFLGLQTQCCQCHDHPFNKEWVQSDFWGVNAFFRQTVRSATPGPMARNMPNGPAQPVTLTDDPSLNPELITYYERRDGRRLGSFPVMLKDYDAAQNGQKSTKMLAGPVAGKSRRQQLAEWVVAHDNFGKAYVNRLWAHFFGRGLNKEPSADDFGSNNEIVHGELLTFLGDELAKYNYDPKRLMEWICTSEVYSLSHVGTPATVDIKFDPFFARMPLKAMSPEVLFESLMLATKADKRNPEQRKAARDAWMRKLVRQFGDDEGNELSFNGTIVQALLMMNGTELNGEIGVGRNADATNVVAELVKKHTSGGSASPKAIYDDLFLLTLNRHMTTAEFNKLEFVRSGKAEVLLGPPPAPVKPGPKGPATPPKSEPPKYAQGAGPNDVGFYQDVFWALLNTNEFMINH